MSCERCRSVRLWAIRPSPFLGFWPGKFHMEPIGWQSQGNGNVATGDPNLNCSSWRSLHSIYWRHQDHVVHHPPDDVHCRRRRRKLASGPLRSRLRGRLQSHLQVDWLQSRHLSQQFMSLTSKSTCKSSNQVDFEVNFKLIDFKIDFRSNSPKFSSLTSKSTC